jgi:hypothetical protein
MSARMKRTIPFLISCLALAFMGARFVPAQSRSAPVGGKGEESSDAAQDVSRDARTSATKPQMASQWTAGAKSFGPASDQSWGQRTTSFVPGSRAMWNPGIERFGVSAQPGGIWQSRGQQAMRRQEPWSQNSSQEMNQSATGNPQGMDQSTTGNPQRMDQSTTGNPFSAGASHGFSSNSWATPAVTSQKRSTFLDGASALNLRSQDRTGSRRTRGSTSAQGMSGLFSGRTVGLHGSASPSFGTGRTSFPRISGSRPHRASSRRSVRGTTLGERGHSSGSRGQRQADTSLVGRSSEQDQGLELKGFESNLSKGKSGNGAHLVGNMLDSHRGLATSNHH